MFPEICISDIQSICSIVTRFASDNEELEILDGQKWLEMHDKEIEWLMANKQNNTPLPVLFGDLTQVNRKCINTVNAAPRLKADVLEALSQLSHAKRALRVE